MKNECVRGLFDGWMAGVGEGEMNLAVVYSRCDPDGDGRKKRWRGLEDVKRGEG